MLSLAIEMSTSTGSLALGRNGACLAQRAWNQQDRPHQILFDMLPVFLKDAGVAPADINRHIVGIGPGSFSGIRVALAAANGLALPGGVPVHGLPSAAAIAWTALRTATTPSVTVIGDARRNRIWLARYRRERDTLVTEAEPALHPLDALPAALTPETCILSPDWERLKPLLEKSAGTNTLIRESRHPDAAALLELAEQHARANAPLRPPQPLYLHPPV